MNKSISHAHADSSAVELLKQSVDVKLVVVTPNAPFTSLSVASHLHRLGMQLLFKTPQLRHVGCVWSGFYIGMPAANSK